MEQNNKNNIEAFDSSSETVVFNPISDEKIKNTPPDRKPAKDIYEAEDDDKYEDEEASDINGILIGIVIVLVILFIAALIWGTSVLNKMNKKEEVPPAPPESEEIVEEIIQEPGEEIIPQEGEKIKCEISFKSQSVEEEDYGYTIRAIFKDEDGKYYTERLTVDSETQIKEDGDSLSYKSFVNNVIEKLGSKEVEFDAVVDIETNHIDSISYKSEIFENDEEGIVLEDDETGETSEENVIE